jgi:hypothetical protein
MGDESSANIFNWGQPPKLEDLYIPEPRPLAGTISKEEYKASRKNLFAEVKQYIDFPELIQAIKEFKPRSRIVWKDENGGVFDPETASNDALAEAVVISYQKSVTPEKSEPDEGTDDLADARKRAAELLNPKVPDTAGELFALHLRDHLQELEAAEQASRKGISSEAPVRERGMLPRSSIAELAVDLLEDCMANSYPPGPQLTSLITSLLKVKPATLVGSPTYPQKYAASWILSHHLTAHADIGPRPLARAVSVPLSTAQGWLRDPKFIREAEDREMVARLMQRLKERGK